MKIHDGMPWWTPALDDRLCELVSDLDAQYTFGDIARIMGLSKNAVTSRWRRIVARMGEGA